MTARVACSRGRKYRSRITSIRSSPEFRYVITTGRSRSMDRTPPPAALCHSAIMSVRRLPVSETSNRGWERVSASTTSGTLDGQRR
jgi:hypothetical protein